MIRDRLVSARFGDAGFTLIELVVAMVIAAILMASITMAFHTQQESQVREQMVLEMQQNVRAALQVMEREIRMAGYDPTIVWGTDGIDNNEDFEVDDSAEAQNNRMADGIDNDCDGYVDNLFENRPERIGITTAQAFEVRFSMDLGGNRDYCEADEHVAYGFALKYDGKSGPRDGLADYVANNSGAVGVAPIGRATQNGGSLMGLATDIEALSFAYAFDMNRDGQIDRNATDLIWAYDSDNDGDLDVVLDTNGDGAIDIEDDSNNDGRIDAADGPGLMPEVPLDRIRAVKIWLLSRTPYPVRGHRESRTYVVGDKIINGADVNRDGNIDTRDAVDHHQRRLLSTTVACRNLGLQP